MVESQTLSSIKIGMQRIDTPFIGGFYNLPSSRKMSASAHIAAAVSRLSPPVTSRRMSRPRRASTSAASGRPSLTSTLAYTGQGIAGTLLEAL